MPKMAVKQRRSRGKVQGLSARMATGLIACSGERYVGITSVFAELCKRDPAFKRIPLVTTRPPETIKQAEKFICEHPTEFEYLRTFDQQHSLLFTYKKGDWEYGVKGDDLYRLQEHGQTSLLYVPEECMEKTRNHILRYFPEGIVSFYLYVADLNVLDQRFHKLFPDQSQDDREQLVLKCKDAYVAARTKAVEEERPYFFIDNSGTIEETVNQMLTHLIQKPASKK